MNFLGTEVTLGAWSASAGELSVQLPAWPLALGPMAAVAGATAAALWAAAASKGGRGSPLGALVVLLVGVLGVGVLARLALAPERSELAVATPFAGALGMVVGLAGMGLMAGVLGASVWVAAPIRSGGASTATALAAFATALAGLGAAGSTGQAIWIHSLGSMPLLELTGPLTAHIGTPRTLVPNPTPGWTIEPVTVAPPQPGLFPTTLSAHRWGAVARRVVHVEAGQDQPNPVLPLQPGAWWRFSRTRERHDQLLWFISSTSRQEGEGPTLRVVGSRVEAGLRVWDVDVASERGTTRHVVYGWNGETRSLADNAAWVTASASSRRDASGLWVRDCTVGGLDGGCVCSDAPPGAPRTLAGPLLCAHTASAPLADSLAAVFVGIVTVGLVLQDPSPAVTDTLVASGIDP